MGSVGIAIDLSSFVCQAVSLRILKASAVPPGRIEPPIPGLLSNSLERGDGVPLRDVLAGSGAGSTPVDMGHQAPLATIIGESADLAEPF
jgi:hypothetical protein